MRGNAARLTTKKECDDTMEGIILNLPPIAISALSALLFTVLCLTKHQRKKLFEAVTLIVYVLTAGIWWMHGYPSISIVMLTPLLTYISPELPKEHKEATTTRHKFIMAEIGFTAAPLLCFSAITAGWGRLTCLLSAGILLISSEKIFGFIQQKVS